MLRKQKTMFKVQLLNPISSTDKVWSSEATATWRPSAYTVISHGMLGHLLGQPFRVWVHQHVLISHCGLSG